MITLQSLLIITGMYESSLSRVNEKKRYKPGILTLLEIRKYQRSTFLLIKKMPFFRLVKRITQKYTKKNIRWNSNSIFLLQEITETIIVNFLMDSNLCALHAKRLTVSKHFLYSGQRYTIVIKNQRPIVK